MEKRPFHIVHEIFPFCLLLFAIIILSSCGNSSKRDMYTRNDIELRDGVYFEKGTRAVFSGKIGEEFSDGSMLLSARIEHGSWEGDYVERYPSGKMKVITTYLHGEEQPGGHRWAEDGTEILPGGEFNESFNEENTRHYIIETIKAFSENNKYLDIFSGSCKAVFTDPMTLAFSFYVDSLLVYEYTLNLKGILAIEILPEERFKDKQIFLYKLKITTDPAYASSSLSPGSEVNLVEVFVWNPESAERLSFSLRHLCHILGFGLQ